MRLSFSWSHTAAQLAGSAMPELEDRMLAECTDIGFEAHGWFAHVITLADKDEVFLLVGRQDQSLPETEATWNIKIRAAKYVDKGLPETLPGENNERFGSPTMTVVSRA